MSDATYGDRDDVTGWVGWIAFAGVIMIIAGVLNFIYGLIAAVNDDWVVFGNRANLYLDLNQWGWVHMILGVVVALAGGFLFTGNILARTVGVIDETWQLIDIEYADPGALADEVVSFGADVLVEKPDELRERVMARLRGAYEAQTAETAR